MRTATRCRSAMAVGFRFSSVVVLTGAMTVLIFVALRSPARATPEHKSAFNQRYETSGSRLDECTTCHTTMTDAEHLNNYGLDFRNANHDFAAIEQLDSDGDGSSNVDEINARTFPGDPNDHPQAPAPAPEEPPPTTAVPPSTQEPAPAPAPDAPPATQDPAPPQPSGPASAAEGGLPRTGVGVLPFASVGLLSFALGTLLLAGKRRAQR